MVLWEIRCTQDVIHISYAERGLFCHQIMNLWPAKCAMILFGEKEDTVKCTSHNALFQMGYFV